MSLESPGYPRYQPYSGNYRIPGYGTISHTPVSSNDFSYNNIHSTNVYNNIRKPSDDYIVPHTADPAEKSKKTYFDLSNMFYFTILLVILYLMITGWDAFIDTVMEKWLGLNPETIFAQFMYAAIFTLISILFLWVLDEDFGYLFGIESGSTAGIGGGIAVHAAR